MSLFIKNVDTVNVALDDLGITLAPAEQYDLTQDRASSIADSSDLPAAVTAGTIAVLDPLDDITPLTITEAQAAVAAMNDTHYRIRGGTLNQLDDVNLAGAASGYVLQLNSSGIYVPIPPSTVVNDSSSVNAISNQLATLLVDGNHTTVVTTGSPPTSIQIDAAMAVGDLTDVNLSGAAAGDVLQYDGTSWQNIPGGGGSTSPGGVDTNVQYNNGGVFGGENNFIYDDINKRTEVQGPTEATRLILHSGTDPLETAQIDNSVFYMQVDGDNTYEGLRCYFKRSSPGISGWISYHYDQATPNMRLTDEDDDAPYIAFQTIASGTYDLPEFVSAFGARGGIGSRDPGADETGFAWVIGSGVDPRSLYITYNPVMELDSYWLRIPTGTTAQRPPTPENGMIRYNTTANKFEGYENGSWKGFLAELFHAHNGAVTQTLTGTFVTLIVGTDVRSDPIYSNNNGEVTINGTGWFKVTADFSGDATSTTRSAAEMVLQVDGVDVPGSHAYSYHRNTTAGTNTSSSTVIVQITSGQVIRIRVRENAGSAVTVADACRLTITQVA